MIIINKESNLYPVVANVVSCIFGFGASILVGGFCNSLISSQQPGVKKAIMHTGKYGLECISMYEVSSQVRCEIDELVDGYNDFAKAMNLMKSQQEEGE